MPAPRNPWIARQTIISSIVVAKPHKKLAMVKPEAEIANNSRVPSARDRKPDSGIAITSAIRYAVWTHDTSVELADRPAWMSVSDAETIWMSRIDMNIPNTMIRNATSRRGAMRSGGKGALIIAGVAVVTSAMALLRMDHHRRVEVGGVVGILGALVGVDGGVDRHAGAQQIFPRDRLGHADADREPLDDLGEIAGGVIRRQQC